MQIDERKLGKWKSKITDRSTPSRVKLSSFDPPSSTSSTFFLLSFLSVTSYRLQLRFQTRVIDWFSRFTSACHVRPFSSKTLPVSKQSSMQTQGNEVMHLELCNFVLIETKLQPEILSLDYIRHWKQTTLKIIFQHSGENVSSKNC